MIKQTILHTSEFDFFNYKFNFQFTNVTSQESWNGQARVGRKIGNTFLSRFTYAYKVKKKYLQIYTLN